MNTADFEYYRALLKDRSGMALSADKTYLLESRLTPLARHSHFASLDAMTGALRTKADPVLVNAVVQAMTINETSFFRDDKPFRYMREVVLPSLMKARDMTKVIRIWSAASSTGQEAYSIAMTMAEAFAPKSGAVWRADILGTDLSDAVLDQARRGEYTQFEVQRGLPIQLLMKNFTQTEHGGVWKINESLRKMVRFQPFNLLSKMDSLGAFDVVFCRNVLIYFDEPTKKKILKEIVGRLPPDGFLFLGGSETILGLSDDLKIVPGYSGLYVLQARDTSSIVPHKVSPAVFPAMA